jgi:CRP/FNR family cyclic AMP-dependent transcriptional regulator
VTRVQASPDPFPDAEVRSALEHSPLARLPDRLRDQLLAEAVRAELPKGRLLDGPPLALVVSGLIRVALAGPDGRRFAVAYLHRGHLAGLARLTGRRYPLSFETVTDCRLLRLGEPAFQDLLRRHTELGVAVAEQLNRHIDDILNETALAAFGHVRQRVLRHLLALAVIDPAGPASCQITHQELADAVGAARETVTRVISELRSDGLLEGNHGRLAIPDPQRLRRELAP